MSSIMPLPIPALSPIAVAVKALYRTAKHLNDAFDGVIDDMKQSPNPTISRSGRVLEGAKYGFGLGYISSATIVAAGQFLLGNPLTVMGTVSTAVVFTNPVVNTCAALGAVVYGYRALSDVEREELLTKLSNGLQIGVELVKSIIKFVVDETQRLLSKENVAEMKKFIAEAAESFGRTLSDVTHKVRDKVVDGFASVKEHTAVAGHKTAELTSDAVEAVSEAADEAINAVRKKLSRNKADEQGPKELAAPDRPD